jgi:hypothetical protein
MMSEITETKNEKTSYDLLLEEYKGIIPQIIHWDSHFWNKSKFFLTFESAFLAGTILTLRENVSTGKALSVSLFWILVGVAVFNLYLSYVWFRTNRRNREFLELRFRRAREIEAALGGIQKIFTNDPLQLTKGHGSAYWEIHLATGFAVAWVVLLGVGIFLKF